MASNLVLQPDGPSPIRTRNIWSLLAAMTNVCAANLRLLAWSPILTVGSYIRALSAQLERPENKGSRLVQISPATLGGLPARNIIITIDRQGSALTEHQIVARKGMTLHVLATDSLTESTENCELDFQFIQQRLGLSR